MPVISNAFEKGAVMDDKLRAQLEKMIEKYNIRLSDDGIGITWSGFPDKRGIAQIKMNTDAIIELIKGK